MITAVDTSVILDVLTDDQMYGIQSEAALKKAGKEGKLIVCECVIAEIFPALNDEALFSEFLSDWHLEFSPIELASAVLAGRHFGMYLSRSGRTKRVVPDFLIGAHAEKNADRLLARDRGYLKDYFKDLILWDPSH